MTRALDGNFFEDFSLGQSLIHATPRTLTEGDVAIYLALTGSRFTPQCSRPLALAMGYRDMPVDDLLAFHIAFGKTVPDISLNAVANLGYAEGRFLMPVYAGDTLTASSEVIGLKQNSNGKTGVVTVRTTGVNQLDEAVLSYVRWVMVNKRTESASASPGATPSLQANVIPSQLVLPGELDFSNYDFEQAGSPHAFEDYRTGEKIDHVDGMTVEEAEHQMATRLYQNNARVHFDAMRQKESRFGRRLVYGGHVLSIARALSFNGLGNAFHIAAINGGRHVAPLFSGDTVYAWSEIVEKADPPGRVDAGALRIRTVATKDRPCGGFPYRTADGNYDPAVLLDFDYWALTPR